ncbi:sulfotransferase [Rubritalea marina]|uniref:sulfotransferase n=1 Tax=Rubritalea marina TaxID=361055 RepID=UPI00039CE997|nr:sulfotransferase [Rubritalea marina]
MDAKEESSAGNVIYVLGLPYSGSTLFGLALGQHSAIHTIGEMNNIESDYNPKTQCSCGEKLQDCTFWNGMRSSLQKDSETKDILNRWDSSGNAARHIIDRRGGLRKILVVLGIPLQWIYGRQNCEEYERTNLKYFRGFQSYLPSGDYCLDLSKSPERLELLDESLGAKVKVIYVKRRLRDVYASILKRPKRTRKYYGPKALREALWLFLRARHCDRVFARISDSNKAVVNLSEFIDDPKKVLSNLDQWMGLDPVSRDGFSPRHVELRSQHVFVGNTWVKRSQTGSVEIRESKARTELTRFQATVFRLVLGARAEQWHKR